ncbi:hypothetical protein BKA69DRAFT_1061986, partial [Paraphysoderma sedebokerense]
INYNDIRKYLLTEFLKCRRLIEILAVRCSGETFATCSRAKGNIRAVQTVVKTLRFEIYIMEAPLSFEVC